MINEIQQSTPCVADGDPQLYVRLPPHQLRQRLRGMLPTQICEAVSLDDVGARIQDRPAAVCLVNFIQEYYDKHGWETRAAAASLHVFLASPGSDSFAPLLLAVMRDLAAHELRVGALLEVSAALLAEGLECVHVDSRKLAAITSAYCNLTASQEDFVGFGRYFFVPAVVNLLQTGASEGELSVYCSAFSGTDLRDCDHVDRTIRQLRDVALLPADLERLDAIIKQTSRLNTKPADVIKLFVEIHTFSKLRYAKDGSDGAWDWFVKNAIHHLSYPEIPLLPYLEIEKRFVAEATSMLTRQTFALVYRHLVTSIGSNELPIREVVDQLLNHPPIEEACKNFISFAGSKPGATGDELQAAFVRVLSSGVEHSGSYPSVHGLEVVARTKRGWGDELKAHAKLADMHRGYASALRFDATRLPGEVLSPIVRTGLELGLVQMIHAKTPQRYPGGGVLIKDLELGLIFAPDPDAPADPYHQYKETWPQYAKELEHLSRTQYLLLRGFFGIIGPKGYTLEVAPGTTKHLSILYFNHHFDQSLRKAFLVETAFLIRKLGPCIVNWRPDWKPGQIDEIADDVNAAGLSPEELLAAGARGEAIVIDIGSPETLLSGFAYGFPREFEPLFAFERSLRKQPIENVKPDVFGRYHLEDVPDDVLVQYRRQLPTLESKTEALVKQYGVLADLFKVVNAYVHKGYAGRSGIGIDYRIGKSQLQNTDILPNPVEIAPPERADPGESSEENEVALIQLYDGLKRHRALKAAGRTVTDDDPVIVSCNTASYSEAPDADFMLDLRTLEAKLNGKDLHLFENRENPVIDSHTRAQWFNVVMPTVADTFRDIRTMARGNLKNK